MALVNVGSGSRVVIPAVLAGVLWLGAGAARADRITLRGGGQIRGKVVADAAHPGRVTVLTETGKTPLTFQKPQILRVDPEPSALDDYVAKREKAPDTADGQYALGAWCEEHKLADLATLHYEASLKRDPAFESAHKKLGHVLYGDRWLTGDELREAQGLVRYKGKWITKEERDRHEAAAAANAEQVSWMRRIRRLRETFVNGPIDRSREAEQDLRAIREPVAVRPLVVVLGDDINPVRMLLDQLLGAIPGPEAAAALVHRILAEADPDVRHATMTELERRKERNVIPTLVKALRSANPEIVNRAAWTLSQLDAIAVVPSLIPALITTQYRVVIVENGGTGGGVTASSVTRSGVSSYSNGIVGPPAVSGGSVAFGLSQSSSFSTTPSGPRGPTPKLMAYSYQNVEVLAALVKFTGRDFGYDIPTWKRWVSTSFRPDPAPVRSVPQP